MPGRGEDAPRGGGREPIATRADMRYDRPKVEVAWPSSRNLSKLRSVTSAILASRRFKLIPSEKTEIGGDSCARGYLNFRQAGDLLGKGSFGEVRRVECRCGDRPADAVAVQCEQGVAYSVKRIRIAADTLTAIERESQILSRFDSENIMKLLRYFVDEDNVFAVMEYAGESCEKVGKEWDVPQTINYMQQGADILATLKAKSVVHSDIKPANLCFARATSRLVLVDFGSAFIKDEVVADLRPRGFIRVDPLPSVLLLTDYYRLPSHLMSAVRAPAGAEAFLLDEWSMAVTFFEFAFKSRPFLPEAEAADARQSLYEQLEERAITFPAKLASKLASLEWEYRLSIECALLSLFENHFDHLGKEGCSRTFEGLKVSAKAAAEVKEWPEDVCRWPTR